MTQRLIPYFDAHCDTISACAFQSRALRKNEGHLDLERLLGFSKAAQVFAMYADADVFPAGSLPQQCQKMHDVLQEEVARNSDILTFCHQGRGVKAANAQGKIAALLSIEGGELLNCDPANLERAKSWGVRCINTTWNHANALSGCHKENPEQGLTDIGREWIKESQRLGIFADVSHLSDPGFWDIIEMTTQPVIATHSNSRTVCDHTRNLTDDMFKAICQTGGVVGVNFWLTFVGGTHSMDDVLRHVDHFMELGGAKHLALGGDLDGCAALAGGMKGLEDLHMFWEALSAHGYDDATLEDIFYNNLLRVMEG